MSSRQLIVVSRPHAEALHKVPCKGTLHQCWVSAELNVVQTLTVHCRDMKRLLSALSGEPPSCRGTPQGAMQRCVAPVLGLSRAACSANLNSPTVGTRRGYRQLIVVSCPHAEALHKVPCKQGSFAPVLGLGRAECSANLNSPTTGR